MRFFIAFALIAAAAAQVSNEYLPPTVGGADFGVAASAPEVIYAAPSAVQETYDVAASAPAHSFSSDDGYRYKTQRRRVFKTARRHRRDVSSEYLPPVASAPAASYAAPAVAYSAPAASFSAPAASFSAPAETYDVAASAPAHSFSSDDGYRYKTQRRRVFKTARRHRRDVSSEYLPPVASAPVASFAAPVASYSAPAASYSAPAATYSAPAASYETYEEAASAPAHSFSGDDGYRYKTQRRRVFKTARRHRRDVSSEYLPPVASYSAPAESYAAPAASYSAPAASYSAPAASFSAPAETYDVAASAPAHSFSGDDGYRYKTQRRRVFKTARRHRRDVSSEYLPPVASYSAPAESYAAPAASYSAPAASYSAPAASFSAPAETYDVAASAPAHSFSSDDGYRYKTQRRRVFKTARRHRY